MKANSSETLQQVMARVSHADILYHYFGIDSLPRLICSPFRKDTNPSFNIYSTDGYKVYFKDFATGQHGDIWTMLQMYLGLSFGETVRKVARESFHFTTASVSTSTGKQCPRFATHTPSDIKVKVRDWQPYDIDYWNSYGIGLPWLKYAEVYPISHKIVYKDADRFVFNAAKYAYAFVERKENHVSIKVYQPYNIKHKWSNCNDRSVVGLWTKIPPKGDKLCICSSLKDALCLWSNSGIPCIYVQSETTSMSETAQNVLKSRYSHIYVCFDNDVPGIENAKKFTLDTGFDNVVLPAFSGGKDISDYMKLYGKEAFKANISTLFK